MPASSSFSRYVRVLLSSVYHPKFAGPASAPDPLTASERGTWVTAVILAEIARPEPINEVAVRLVCPGASFERLYERQLIEAEVEEGWFRVHDLDQFRLAPSETPEAAAERQRRSRANRKRSDVTDVTAVTTTDSIRNDSEDVEGSVSESRARTNGAHADGPKHVRGFKRPVER